MIKKSVLLTVFAFFTSIGNSIFSQTNLAYNWAWQFGYGAGDYGISIATDSAGYVFSLGDGGDDSNYTNFAAMLISKTHPLGPFNIGSTGVAYYLPYNSQNKIVPIKLTVDHDGNVFVMGWFSGTIDFDPSTAVNSVTSSPAINYFLLKFDNNLNFIFVKTLMGGFGVGLTIDKFNNLIIGGFFNGTFDFDLNTGVFNLTGFGDTYIAKYDNNMNFIWAKKIGNSQGNEWVNSATVDSSNNILVCGMVSGVYSSPGLDLDPGPGTCFVTNIDPSNNGNYPAQYTVKLDENGNFIWGNMILTKASNMPQNSQIAVDILGNVFYTGLFRDSVDFDPGINVLKLNGPYNSLSGYNLGVYVSKLDANGLFKWAKIIGKGKSVVSGNNSKVHATDIHLDLAGNVYISSTFTDTVDFNPGLGIYNIGSKWPNSALIKLDNDGNFTWAEKVFEQNQSIYSSASIESFAINKNQEFSVIGNFQNTVDFNNSFGTNTMTPPGTNWTQDMFVVKYGMNTTVGIDNNKTTNSIKIFPNPSNGLYELQLNDFESDNINLTVNDVLGKTVFKTKITNTNTKIDLSNHPNGIYFIEIEKVNHTKNFGKIIKQ